MKRLADGRVLGIGYVIAKANKMKSRRRTVLPVQRTIDISDIPDHLLYFWSEKHRKGASCKEIGHAYGMNGHQMRNAISQWRKKNQTAQAKPIKSR
jgi:transposase-like protein